MVKNSSSSVEKYNGIALSIVLIKTRPLNMCKMYPRVYLISWSIVAFVRGFEN